MVEIDSARAIGATAGAVLALVYAPPRRFSGLIRRAVAAVIFGYFFAFDIQSKMLFLDSQAGLTAAACLGGFVSWIAMGVIWRSAERAAERWNTLRNDGGKNNNSA